MHVAITGASSGIGEALAREYARAGAAVTLVARRRKLLDRIVTAIAEGGGKALAVTADLADPARACEFIAPAEAVHGPIDVLVNNAGVQIVRLARDVTPVEAEALLALNLATPLRLIDRVLPAMLARGAGTIVNVASAAAWSTVPGMMHYNASKAGLAAASETLRAELRGTGVHVLTVYPGPVHTPMGDAGFAAYGDSPAARLQPTGRPDVLAARVRRAAMRRSKRLVYPRAFHVVRLFPNLSRLVTDRFAPHPIAAPPRGQATGRGTGG